MNREYTDPTTGLSFLAQESDEAAQGPGSTEPANAGGYYGPAGPETDAEQVYRDYQALAGSERQRFWLFLNDGEQDFTLSTLRDLKKGLDRARVDITDRAEYDRAYERIRDGLGRLGANAAQPEDADESLSGREVDGPADEPETRRQSPAGRGRILGARARR